MLVTGGAGFIGCNFVRYWCERYPQDKIVVLDALTYAGDRDHLQAVWQHPGFQFVEGDIQDNQLVVELLEKYNLNTIVHFAAETHVDRSIANPDIFIQSNVLGTHSLLKAARQVWLESKPGLQVHHFHHVSTDEVYGSLGLVDPPFTEETPYAPNSPYSASKAASDHLVRAYHHTYGLNVTTSNCSNNFGPYQHAEKLIPTVILCAAQGEAIPIYGRGSNIRDWLYVEDHCLGIELILDRGKVGETYNIGGSNEHSNLELVYMICDLMDKIFAGSAGLRERYPHCPSVRGRSCKELITFVQDRPGHDLRYGIDGAKLQKLGAGAGVIGFMEGLVVTIKYVLQL